MLDPIDNFQIPNVWVSRSKLPLEELASMISSGRYVLLSDGCILRRGYTTGTTAAAAAKASVLSLTKEIREVSVPTPIGIRARLPVIAKEGKASAIKDSGDHAFDITDGIKITAEARINDVIIIKAGAGIGLKNNKPAINPNPMRQIHEAIKEALIEANLRGALVTISVPGGEEVAEKTLNRKIGICGGISILGTTGFVEPWNEHLGEMKEELIRKTEKLVLTTGRIGFHFSHMLFPDHDVVLIGSDISKGLKAAQGKVIICGLPGLVLKWANPDILNKSGYLTVEELINHDPSSRLIDIALEASAKASGGRIVLLNRKGVIIRDTEKIL